MSKFKPMSQLLLMILLLLLAVMPAPAVYAQTADCSTVTDAESAAHLATGFWGKVASGIAHNQRAEPSIQAAIVGQIPADDVFRVLDGPRCADGYVWWQVDYTGNVGWSAEGNPDDDEWWLAALDGQESPAEPDADGCLLPPEDYTQVKVQYGVLNARTLAMLDYAQEQYRAEGGIINFRTAIMQGSYNPGGVSASFGTHDGGGAIDLSVRDSQDRRVLTAEIEPMIAALRLAGFAAWLRDADSLYPGSPIHTHAIAIGDAELSQAASEQIDGDFGYLRGYDGLPQDDGVPQPDTSGTMVLCGWMSDMGYEDLRSS
jgi:hypothetical protein